MGMMLKNLVRPYIQSTTVLCDNIATPQNRSHRYGGVTRIYGQRTVRAGHGVGEMTESWLLQLKSAEEMGPEERRTTCSL